MQETQAKNKYLESVIPKFYRMQQLDVMCFTFVDTYRFLYPSVTIIEAVDAFVKRYNISEDLQSAKSFVQTYTRVNAALFEAEKRENQEKK